MHMHTLMYMKHNMSLVIIWDIHHGSVMLHFSYFYVSDGTWKGRESVA